MNARLLPAIDVALVDGGNGAARASITPDRMGLSPEPSTRGISSCQTARRLFGVPACWYCHEQPHHITTGDRHHIECPRCVAAGDMGPALSNPSAFRTRQHAWVEVARIEWARIQIEYTTPAEHCIEPMARRA